MPTDLPPGELHQSCLEILQKELECVVRNKEIWTELLSLLLLIRKRRRNTGKQMNLSKWKTIITNGVWFSWRSTDGSYKPSSTSVVFHSLDLRIWKIPPQRKSTTEGRRPGPTQDLPAWITLLFHLLHFSLHLIHQPASQWEGDVSDLCTGPSVVGAMLPSPWPAKKSVELWIKSLENKVLDELPGSFHWWWEVRFLIFGLCCFTNQSLFVLPVVWLKPWIFYMTFMIRKDLGARETGELTLSPLISADFFGHWKTLLNQSETSNFQKHEIFCF